MNNGDGEHDIQIAEMSVLKKSSPLPTDSITIKGYDFNEGINYDNLLDCYMYTGFQASHFAQAVQVSM
ncbi:unnamed protein product [Onchocerca flexuosa]|uniref:Uncharacterized protein n=1 Tax=Onchocerca flexuosa TaxID=387005 RepID=A0A183HFV3_9BILA|nr:unnamed protein product [Onchocerca flexuosa]